MSEETWDGGMIETTNNGPSGLLVAMIVAAIVTVVLISVTRHTLEEWKQECESLGGSVLPKDLDEGGYKCVQPQPPTH